jgi:hypothetical protein
MVTTIDVINSAVKIGLGALISGLATYLVAKSSRDKTIAKERAQRKRDMLEAVAQHVSAFHNAALGYWAAVTNWLAFTPPNEPMAEIKHAELGRLGQKVSVTDAELVTADAKLLILGEMKSHTLLRDYGKSIVHFRVETVAARQITVAQLEEYRETINKTLDAFFAEPSGVYRRT